MGFFSKDYKRAYARKCDQTLFPDYLIKVETDKQEGRELCLRKTAELLNGTNFIIVTIHLEFEETESIARKMAHGKFPCDDYMQLYCCDTETLRTLGQNAEYVMAKIYPQEYDWERMLQEELKYAKPWQPYVSFEWDSPCFEFRLSYPHKDFGNELLRNLNDLGYKIKIY